MDLKKFASNAETLFHRVVQFTEEKLLKAEVTEYDESFRTMLETADKTKLWTERLISRTESFLQPNPAVRLEQTMQEKIQGYKDIRFTEMDILGMNMIQAGNDLVAGAPSYGQALQKCGEVQQNIGTLTREFIHSTVIGFINPLQDFLDVDIKNLQKERSTLETTRLDMDAAKSKLKRSNANEPDHIEAEVRRCESAFEKQVEVVRSLLTGVINAHAVHLRLLQDFVESEGRYYQQCQQCTTELLQQLSAR